MYDHGDVINYPDSKDTTDTAILKLNRTIQLAAFFISHSSDDIVTAVHDLCVAYRNEMTPPSTTPPPAKRIRGSASHAHVECVERLSHLLKTVEFGDTDTPFEESISSIMHTMYSKQFRKFR